MKKLYEKNELAFALVWIGLYCAAQSAANGIAPIGGVDYSIHAIVSVLLTAALVGFIGQNGLWQRYGLCKSVVPARKLLWYLPLVLLSSSNLWRGARLTMPPASTLMYLLTMLCVGFLEEIIFRGLLFKAMARDNVKTAVIVSSLTFGLGHLLNLVNGSGMALAANLCQVVGAMAIGFLFVMLFWRTGTLLPCIAAHSAINMLSAFANESGLTDGGRMLSGAAISVAALAYAVYVSKMMKDEKG